MISIIRKSIPAPAKQLLKKSIVDPLRAELRNRRLRRCIQLLRSGDHSIQLLAEFRTAWGNEGFSADLRYVEEAARLARACEGPILECGTGLTTLICAVIAEQRSIDLWCLEQDKEWLNEVRRALDRNKVKAKLHLTRLKNLGDHAWYDITSLKLPKHFGLVICDGPCVSSDWTPPIHAAWRYGVVPALKRSGISFDGLLLDDANDTRAPALLKRWSEEFGIDHRVINSNVGDCAIVTPAAEAENVRQAS